MHLQEKIDQDLLQAMKNREEPQRSTLRLLKSALKNAEIEKGSALSDEEMVSVIQKEVKRRREAIESYRSIGKTEQAEEEQREAEILAAYLPEQMSEGEIRVIIEKYLAENPSSTDKMGQVMGSLSPQFKGKADMGAVSRIVREQLSKNAN